MKATARSAWTTLLRVLVCLTIGAPPLAAAASNASAIPRPPEIQKDVDFWIRVYSEVTTNEGFLHDEADLSIVYETMRFAPKTPSKDRQAVVDEARKRYIALLGRLAATARGTAAEATLTTAAERAEEARVRTLFGANASAQRLEQATQGIRFQLGQADRFRAGIVRSGAWSAHIAETMANMGLPPEIAALPHVESSFNPAAYSKVGAAGLWQFMRSTGRRYMRIDSAVDERMDPFRATEAAAQLLAYNYRLLDSWPLALTAYNHGAAGMRRAVEATGTTDFVRIARTYRSRTFGFASRNFYPSFLAALAIEENPEKYFGPIERAPEAKFVEVEVPAFARVRDLERVVAVERAQLRLLNPALLPTVWNGERLVPRGYRLRLPESAQKWSSETLAQRLAPTEQFAAQIESRSHRVAGGQTLEAIAKRYGLTTQALAAANGISATAALKKGRTLRLPDRMPPLVATAASYAAADTSDPERTYVVKRGDTLSQIAARVSVPERELLKLNALRSPNFIYEGQRLRLAAVDAAEQAAEVAALGSAADVTGIAERAAMAERGGTGAKLPPTAAERETAEDVAAAASQQKRATQAQPVSVAQAEALGPALVPAVVPGAEAAPAAADSLDYGASTDNSIRVAGAETLGHYADWLGISASRLRAVNKLKMGQPVLLGRRLTLEFANVTPEAFEQKRREYHAGLQANFFAAHRIRGTEVYVVRRGDTLWSITQRYASVPVWLLQQYNPDQDFAELRPGQQLVMPRVEAVAAA